MRPLSSRPGLGHALLLLCPLLLLGCQSAPGAVIHGVVSDADTGSPIANVEVQLRGADALPPVTTGADGYFSFQGVRQTHGLILSFTHGEYEPEVIELEPLEVSVDGSTRGEKPDGVNASVQLHKLSSAPPPPPVSPGATFTVGGWVYAGEVPAAGAKVGLSLRASSGATYVGFAQTDAAGRFDIAGVEEGNYDLRVWPHDVNGDGIADYRLYSRDLGHIGVDGTVDLAQQVIVLEQPSTELLASSFVALSTTDALRPRGYPVQASELAGGVSALLRDGTSSIWMHWGTEVDADMTSFELRPVDASGRVGAPIEPLAVSWEHGVLVRLTPPAALVGSANADARYELRITSLRFRNGQAPFSPQSPGFGRIGFALHAQPELLTNPTPVLHVAGVYADGQVATAARVDAAGAWLTDANGDVVDGYAAPQHWTGSTGLQLAWPHVAGATSYRVYARNTTTTGTVGDNRTQWQQVNALVPALVDPAAVGRPIVATGVMAGNFGMFGTLLDGIPSPWLFGNSVAVAVVAVDENGFEAPVDESRALVLRDSWGPMVESGTLDWRAGTGELAPQPATGAVFRAVVQLNLSEPVLTSTVPTLVPAGGTVSLTAGPISWDLASVGAPMALASRRLAIPVDVRVRGACTELMYSRNLAEDGSGDFAFPVRSVAPVPANADALLLTQAGVWGAQLVQSKASGTDTLTATRLILPAATSAVPAGSLVCALSGADTTQVTSITGSTLGVVDASMLSPGQQLMVVEPGTCTEASCTRPVVTVATLNSLDTEANTVELNTTLPAAHTTASVVFPWRSGLSTLRPETSLSLVADAAAGDTATLRISSASGLRVGDRVLVDQDGLQQTTGDQAVVVISDIIMDATGTRLRTSLPRSLVRGRATVVALGDGIRITGLTDTSGNALRPERASLSPAFGGMGAPAGIWGTQP